MLTTGIMITADITTNFTAAFEDPAFCNGVIDKLTIVANQQYRALIAVDQFFQQFQRFDIKIVGRFVKNQQTGRAFGHCGK